MVASVGVEESPRFTSADEVLMRAVAAYFEAAGFEIERDTGSTYDSYWIARPGSINPAWIIVRQDSGAYELQDGLLLVERRGDSLRDVLMPAWVPALAA